MLSIQSVAVCFGFADVVALLLAAGGSQQSPGDDGQRALRPAGSE